MLLAAGCLLAPACLFASDKYASIIIDDLGDNIHRATEAARLPAPVAVAILPDTPYAETTARLARKHGKDVILHMPMQSVRHHHKHASGTLKLHMSERQFVNKLKSSIASIPHLVGINNHMGSLLTRHPGHMKWLMRTLAQQESLFFVDSRTTDKSVALQIANEYDIPSVQRDVFLDPDFDNETVEQQFQRFIRIAREKGAALAIAHPHPVSLQVIREKLDELKRHGIKLVSLTDYVNKRSKQHVSCTGTACAGL